MHQLRRCQHAPFIRRWLLRCLLPSPAKRQHLEKASAVGSGFFSSPSKHRENAQDPRLILVAVRQSTKGVARNERCCDFWEHNRSQTLVEIGTSSASHVELFQGHPSPLAKAMVHNGAPISPPPKKNTLATIKTQKHFDGYGRGRQRWRLHALHDWGLLHDGRNRERRELVPVVSARDGGGRRHKWRVWRIFLFG